MTREAQAIVDNREDAQSPAAPAPLVEVTRGRIVESRHHGHVVVFDGEGRMLASLGSPEMVTYLRSSSKPHQTVPLVATGAADHFGFTDAEIALACGSHNGEEEHTGTALSMLRKVGLDESALHCGPQEPYSEEAAEELKRRGLKPSALHNNCSGKHAAMLALAVYLQEPVENYEEFQHPVQQLIARTVAEFAGVSLDEMGIGTDGCSAPNFAVSVQAMALMYARFVNPSSHFDERTREACRRISRAMFTHPEMVEGRGELDTELMKVCGGGLISKVGAEGVYTAGVLPSEKFPRGLGIAFKIEDGDKGDRARSPVAVEILRQVGVLEDVAGPLHEFAHQVLRNHRGDEVGEVRTSFELGSLHNV